MSSRTCSHGGLVGASAKSTPQATGLAAILTAELDGVTRRSRQHLTVGGDAGKERNSCSAMSVKTVLLIHSVEDSLAHR